MASISDFVFNFWGFQLALFDFFLVLLFVLAGVIRYYRWKQDKFREYIAVFLIRITGLTKGFIFVDRMWVAMLGFVWFSTDLYLMVRETKRHLKVRGKGDE